MPTTEVRKAPPRENVVRSAPFTVTRADDDTNSDGLTLSGYAAVFDTPTRIDSWEGAFDEQIAKGAFRKSLTERTPVLQFDHGSHPRIGSLPIGVIDRQGTKEDDQGLAVTARLFDDPETGLLRQAIDAGAINGMSFRFTVVRDEWRDTNGKLVKDDELLDLLWMGETGSERTPLTRTLKEVKVSELGPVVFPAYAETSVSLRAKQFAHDLDADPKFARDVADALILRGLAAPTDPPDPAPLETSPEEPEHPEPENDAPLVEEHPSESTTPDSEPVEQEDRFAAAAARMAQRIALIRERKA